MASGGFVQDFLQDFLHADGSAQQTTTFLWSANAEKTTREQLCATPNTEVVVFYSPREPREAQRWKKSWGKECEISEGILG